MTQVRFPVQTFSSHQAMTRHMKSSCRRDTRVEYDSKSEQQQQKKKQKKKEEDEEEESPDDRADPQPLAKRQAVADEEERPAPLLLPHSLGTLAAQQTMALPFGLQHLPVLGGLPLGAGYQVAALGPGTAVLSHGGLQQLAPAAAREPVRPTLVAAAGEAAGTSPLGLTGSSLLASAREMEARLTEELAKLQQVRRQLENDAMDPGSMGPEQPQGSAPGLIRLGTGSTTTLPGLVSLGGDRLGIQLAALPAGYQLQPLPASLNAVLIPAQSEQQRQQQQPHQQVQLIPATAAAAPDGQVRAIHGYAVGGQGGLIDLQSLLRQQQAQQPQISQLVPHRVDALSTEGQ